MVAHPSLAKTDSLLNDDYIQRYLVVPPRNHVLGRDFLADHPSPTEIGRIERPSVEGRASSSSPAVPTKGISGTPPQLIAPRTLPWRKRGLGQVNLEGTSRPPTKKSRAERSGSGDCPTGVTWVRGSSQSTEGVNVAQATSGPSLSAPSRGLFSRSNSVSLFSSLFLVGVVNDEVCFTSFQVSLWKRKQT